MIARVFAGRRMPYRPTPVEGLNFVLGAGGEFWRRKIDYADTENRTFAANVG